MTVLWAAVDTFALASEPDGPHNTLDYLRVQKDAASAFVFHPTAGAIPDGAVVTVATLRLFAKGAWGQTPTFTCQALGGPLATSQVTWNNQPATAGAVVTASHVSNVDGDEWAFNVGSILTAGYGFKLTRADTGAAVDFHSSEDQVYAPTLELTYSLPPAPPSNLRPSGGRVIATPTPTLQFDVGPDCVQVQVQIDGTAGTFTNPQFDSGPVPSVVGELDLSTTTYAGPTAGIVKSWRVQWHNGIDWSDWSDVSQWVFQPYSTVPVWTYPVGQAAGSAIFDDEATVTYNVAGTQVVSRVTVASVDNPQQLRYDTKRRSGPGTAVALPFGVVKDSGDYVVTAYSTDGYDRQAVPGFPVSAESSQVFAMQGVAGVPGVDELLVTQIGSGPFIQLAWSRQAGQPDAWQIRRDEEIIAGTELTAGLVSDGDENPHWYWIDYTAQGGKVHHYRVEAKVGGVVSKGSPSYDIICFPRGIWLGDPNTERSVLLLGQDSGTWTQPEVAATYVPLRGTDTVRVTQGQRGYEGTISGLLYGHGDQSEFEDHHTLMGMRGTPAPPIPYVVALPQVAFNATLGNITAAPSPSPSQHWLVSVDFWQQGDLLWLGREAIGSQSYLDQSYDYEEGTNGAALTVASNVGAVDVAGAPTYRTSAAVHGLMGFNSPLQVDGGAVSYPCQYVGQCSVYVTPRTDYGSQPGGAANAAAAIRLRPAAGAGFVAYVNLRTAGNLDISDADDHTVAQSTAKRTWAPDKTMRLDVAWTYTTGTIRVVCNIFTSPESQTPDDTMSATFPATAAPGLVQIGGGNNAMSVDYDSTRIYVGNSSSPGPMDPGVVGSASPAWSLPGVPTTTGMTVSSVVAGVDSVDLAYSTSRTADLGDPASPSYVGAQPVSVDGIVKHTLSGLTPNTTYYCKLAVVPGVFAGDLIQFKTAPGSGAFTRKIVLGSCQQNAGSSLTQIAWADAVAWGADLDLHLGDFGYWGGNFTPSDTWQKHLAKYTSHMAAMPTMRQFLQRIANVILADDHEISGNNGDSNAATPSGQVRAASIAAMQNGLAMYPLADTRTPRRGLYGSFMIGPHVRVVVIDGESLDRSLGSDPDTEAKTFLGAVQDAWLRDVLRRPVALNLIVAGKALLGGGNRPEDNPDKPWNYGTWRANYADYIASTLTTDGQPIRTAWLGGDRHANAYCSKTDNTLTPGHPSYIGSGWEMHGLPALPAPKETYTAAYGFDSTKKLPVVQYVQLTLTDDGAGTITLHYLSRETHDTWDYAAGKNTDPATWVVVDGASSTETWTYDTGGGGGGTAPVLDTFAPPAGSVGQPYSYSAALTAGTPPVTFTASGLPPWATMTPSTGEISGIPTDAATYPVTVTATNAYGSATAAGSIVVGTGTAVPVFTKSTPKAGVVGTRYNYTYAASGVPAPTYTLQAGTLPPGLTLGIKGLLFGTPTTAGTYSGIVVRATNTAGSADTPARTIVVSTGAAYAPPAGSIVPDVTTDLPDKAGVNTHWPFQGNYES